MGKRIYINDGWEFTEKWTDSFADFPDKDKKSSDRGADLSDKDADSLDKDAVFSGKDEDSPENSGIQKVRLPHTCRTTPYNYFSENIYQMVCGYRKELTFPELNGKQRIFLVIGACAHSAEIYLNGCRIGEHHSGYTAFRTELTEYLKPGKNRLAVRVDTREQQNIPPFGHVIDYMTYGGLYREVYLEITGEARMADVFVKAEVPEDAPLLSDASVSGAGNAAPDTPDIRKKLKEISFNGTIETEFRLDLPESEPSGEFPDASDGGDGAPGVEIGAEASAEQNLFIRQLIYPYSRENGSLKEASPVAKYELPRPEVQKFEVPLSECRREKRKYLSGEKTVYIFRTRLNGAKLWDAESPSLYAAETELVLREPAGGKSAEGTSSGREPAGEESAGKAAACRKSAGWVSVEKASADREPAGTEKYRTETVIDSNIEVIGFRRSEFRKDGYYLNGRRLPLIGLNRHQSWPYVGYAMPKSQQALDADILKKELKVNAVRTSHYPQSPAFCRRCDELGLLVFTEIPGWQHIGDENWKCQALKNTEDMVLQYRNHPSVILWGVRINESQDDDRLYEKTNEIAHELDASRQTGGVRYIKKSHFLEDVYTYNDFRHDGVEPGCEKKKNVTPDEDRPYLISECNGHMYPTKTFDSEAHRTEHMLRHANVLDAALGEDGISGVFSWCMFDYNTHPDFGSGDRICYHGVMDMYRNPKLAASLYAAQQDEDPVLEISSSMDIGEHPTGNPGLVYIISNADEVRMYKGGDFVKSYYPSDSPYKNLKHGPILIDDYVGPRMGKIEGFSPKQEKDVRMLLNYGALYGYQRLPGRIKAAALRLMLRYRMRPEDAYVLNSKYIGNWGDAAKGYRFEAVKDGQVVKTVVKAPAENIGLSIHPDHTVLREETSYDAASVRIEMRDQNGNRLPFYNGAVTLETKGPIEIIGPKTAVLRGGCGGTYVKTAGMRGEAALILHAEQGEETVCHFTVEKA